MEAYHISKKGSDCDSDTSLVLCNKKRKGIFRFDALICILAMCLFVVMMGSVLAHAGCTVYICRYVFHRKDRCELVLVVCCVCSLSSTEFALCSLALALDRVILRRSFKHCHGSVLCSTDM